MSAERVREDADRWLRQARDDLEAAEALIAAGKFAQTAAGHAHAVIDRVSALVEP